MVDKVVKPSGRFTFRVWFGDSSTPAVRDEVIERLSALGVLFEWYSQSLLAVDGENQELALSDHPQAVRIRPGGPRWVRNASDRLASPDGLTVARQTGVQTVLWTRSTSPRSAAGSAARFSLRSHPVERCLCAKPKSNGESRNGAAPRDRRVCSRSRR